MKTRWHFLRVCLVALAAPAAAPGAEPDPLTPGDAEVVVTIHVRRALQSSVFKKHGLEPLTSLLQHNKESRQLLSAAGLDPLKDVDTIAVSTSGNPAAGGKLLAVVRGRFDPDKVRSAADLYNKTQPGRVKLLPGEPAVWEIDTVNKSLFAAFVDKNTLVASNSKEDAAATVRRAAGPPQPLNRPMRAALDLVKGGECAWLAVVVTEPMRQLLRGDDVGREFAESVRSVTGGLELTDDARLALVVHADGPAAAARVKNKLDDLLKVLNFLGASKDAGSRIAKDLIDSVKLETDRGDAIVRLRVSDAQIEKARKKE